MASGGVLDSGRLWWDNVHLSSYGQALTAAWLAPLMLPLVSEESFGRFPSGASAADLAVAEDDELLGRELTRAHRPVGM